MERAKKAEILKHEKLSKKKTDFRVEAPRNPLSIHRFTRTDFVSGHLVASRTTEQKTMTLFGKIPCMFFLANPVSLPEMHSACAQ